MSGDQVSQFGDQVSNTGDTAIRTSGTSAINPATAVSGSARPASAPGPSRQPVPPPPPVAKVDMYTTRFSAECMQAKTILDRKGVAYSEFIIDHDDESREVMLKRSGGRESVPQIFINGRGIGGVEALQTLQASGQLDVLLGERPRNFVAEEAEAARAADQDAERGGAGRWNPFSRFGRS